MKRIYVLLFVSVLSLSVTTRADNIDLRAHENSEKNKFYPRSEGNEQEVITARIDGLALSVVFSDSVASVISIKDAHTENQIHLETIDNPTDNVEINLPATLPSGTYVLSVYAFGCWWTGEFVYPD